MSKLYLRIFLACLCALGFSVASASETYTYNSNPIDAIAGSTAYATFAFTVDSPLADGSYNFYDATQLPSGFKFTATDGYMTLNSTPDLFLISPPRFNVSGGKIVGDSVYIQDLSVPLDPNFGYPSIYLAKDPGYVQDNVQLTDPNNPTIIGYEYNGIRIPIQSRDISDTPAYWTYSGSGTAPVPEASEGSMSVAGLALLVAVSSRKRNLR